MKGRGGSLEQAYEASIEASRAAGVVTDVDAGAVELGRVVSRHIDRAVSEFQGQELTKALYLMPHVMNVLRELLATPASRVAAAKAVPSRVSTVGPAVAEVDDEVKTRRDRRSWRTA